MSRRHAMSSTDLPPAFPLSFHIPQSPLALGSRHLTLDPFCPIVWGPMFWVKSQHFCPSSY